LIDSCESSSLVLRKAGIQKIINPEI